MSAAVWFLIGSIVLLAGSIGMFVAVIFWRQRIVKVPHPAARPFICDGAKATVTTS